MNFRKLETKIHSGIRNSKLMTLILIPADCEESTFASDRGGKDAIVQRFKPDVDLLLMAWTGEWSTDIFRLTAADLDAQYQPPR